MHFHTLPLPRISFSLLIVTAFWSLLDVAVLDFCRGNAGWFARTVCWVASNWHAVCAQNYPDIAFWTFSPWGLRTSAPQRATNAKKSGLCSEAMLVNYFLCSNIIFNFVVPPQGYSISTIRHTNSFPSAYSSRR